MDTCPTFQVGQAKNRCGSKNTSLAWQNAWHNPNTVSTSTQFVGRISLSAESLGKHLNRQVWIPALHFRSGKQKTGAARKTRAGILGSKCTSLAWQNAWHNPNTVSTSTQFVGRISLSAESLGRHLNRQVWIPALHLTARLRRAWQFASFTRKHAGWLAVKSTA